MARLGEHGGCQPRGGRLAAGAGHGDHPHLPRRIARERVTEAGMSPIGVGNQAERDSLGRDDPLRHHRDGPAGDGQWNRLVAVALIGRPCHKDVSRPAAARVVLAGPHHDVVAPDEAGPRNQLREFDLPAAIPARRPTHPGRRITHDGLLPNRGRRPHGACLRRLTRPSLSEAEGGLSIASKMGQAGFRPPLCRRAPDQRR